MQILLALLLWLPLSVHAEYLGDLSENELNPNSIFNDIGAYGPMGSTSPRNSIGLYGSTISPYSANNSMAIDAPRLYDQEATTVANSARIPWIQIQSATRWDGMEAQSRPTH